MHYATVNYTKKEHIAHITLNRPEVDNIINHQLDQEMEDIGCRINQDSNIYIVVITRPETRHSIAAASLSG